MRIAPFLLASLLAPVGAAAQGLAIEHSEIACVVAGRLSSVEAKVAQPGQVAKARTYFHADDDARWYFVEMKPDAGVFKGALPKPLPATKRLHYYVTVTDKRANETRTEEYSPDVVPDAGACSRKGLVAVAAAASKVAVVAPAGASAAPSGFAASSVAAVGGGVSATALVIGAVALAGGGAAAVVASKGGDEGDDGGSNGNQNAPLIVVEGTVYSDACCVTGIVDPAPGARTNSRRIQGAVVSSSLDSATATTDAQGVFRLNTQTRCVSTPTTASQEFRLTFAAPGCDTVNVVRTWGCVAGAAGPNTYAINLACR